MIKKTFATLRKNPIIVGMIFTVVLLKVITKYTDIGIYLIPFSAMSWIIEYTYGIISVSELFIFFVLAVVAIFVAAPMFHYIYLLAKGKNTKGFYLEGLQRGWWKILLIWTLIFLSSYTIDKHVRYYLIFETNLRYSAIYAIAYTLRAATIMFALLTVVPLVAEQKFITAIRNILSTGKNYLCGSLAVSIIILIAESKIPYTYANYEHAWTLGVLVALLQTALSTLLIIYGMQVYAAKKNEANEDRQQGKTTGEKT